MALTERGNTSKQVYSARGHVVASVRAGVLVLNVHGARHMLKHPPAWCIEVYALEQAQRAGAERIQVTDRDTQIIYRATLAEFRAGAFAIDRGGYGPQLALVLSKWHTGAPDPRQLDLWGQRGH